jgi:lipoprotein signal peptidase
VELVVVLAVACAVVVAWRRSSPLLMCAAALMLLGILTNLGETAVRGYDTDYLWFGSAMRTTPFNLGDVYELCGGVVMAYCCLRAIMAAPRAPAAGRPGRALPGTGR